MELNLNLLMLKIKLFLQNNLLKQKVLLILSCKKMRPIIIMLKNEFKLINFDTFLIYIFIYNNYLVILFIIIWIFAELL